MKQERDNQRQNAETTPSGRDSIDFKKPAIPTRASLKKGAKGKKGKKSAQRY